MRIIPKQLCEDLKLDMADYWQPTAAEYFERVSKPQALEAIKEVGGTDGTVEVAHLKKGELAKRAGRKIDGWEEMASACRFGSPLEISRVHWVKPKLVAEIPTLRERTMDYCYTPSLLVCAKTSQRVMSGASCLQALSCQPALYGRPAFPPYDA